MIDDFSKSPEKKPVRLDNMRAEYEQPDPTVVSPSGQSTTVADPAGNQPADQPTEPTSEPAFRTPEAVSQDESRTSKLFLSPLEPRPAIGEHMPEKQPWWKLRKPNWSRKQWAIFGGIALVIVGSGTVAAIMLTHKPAPVAPPVITKTAPKPAAKPILSPLSGLPVSGDQQNYPVVGVMVENSPDARPQSGLDQAGVVFEAIAEGGITRFLALFQENSPQVLGPVRSSRPYYLDWAQAFDAGYAHVGGSPDALQKIKDNGVKDLDQFYNAGAYHRLSTRFAPHNMYTSMADLRALSISKGYDTSKFTPWVRKAKDEPSKAPAAKSINFGISGAFYNVHYDYDSASNSYKRSEGGEVHVDNETKAQLSPKVVIALAMPYSLMADGYHSDYQTTGSGNMLLFQDGNVVTGTWSKAGPKEQFVFKDGAGADMKLNPGQSWVTVVDDISKATYQP